MAHFAQLDNNNIVINIIVVNNNELLDQEGNEVEQKGIDFCKSLFGENTNWVQTSYNGNIRKNYAGIGFSYDQTKDVFIQPKPYDSWTLNETTCNWEAPVPMPTTELEENQYYSWNESIVNWETITIEN
jgi:hypothetical protein